MKGRLEYIFLSAPTTKNTFVQIYQCHIFFQRREYLKNYVILKVVSLSLAVVTLWYSLP